MRKFPSLFCLQACGGDKPYLHPEYMQKEHQKSYQNALQLFRTARKMGGPEFSQTFEERLQEELQEAYDSFQKHNESKNIFSAARTPAVLFTMMVVSYLVSGVFGFVGLESLANLVNMVLGVFLILLVSWLYVRYSGEYRELGLHIDQLADTLWEKVCSAQVTFSWVIFKMFFCFPKSSIK